MKKILFPFLGDTVGGSHISDLEIVKLLPKDKFEPLCIIHRGDKLQKYMAAEGIRFIQSEYYIPKRLSGLVKHPLTFLNAIFTAKKLIQDNNVDIVYCADGPLRYIWFYASKLARIKYIHTQHQISNINIEKKLSYRFIDYFICNSRFTLSTLPKNVAKGRVKVSAPVIQFNQNQNESYEKDRSEFKIGFIANYREGKRPYIFIDVASQLKEKILNAKFEMYGAINTEQKAQVDKYISNKNLENSLSMNGFVQDVDAILNNLDLIIAPSVDEPFGRVLVEAALRKRPVIASDSGGHKEVIINNKTGYLVEVDNVDEYVKKALELYENKDLYKQIANDAYAHAIKNFLGEKQIPEIIDVINATLENTKA